MPPATNPTTAHSRGWQWPARLTVAFTAMTTFVLGRIFSGEAFSALEETATACLLWALLHITCVLAGTAWAFSQSNVTMRRSIIGLKRKRRRLRNHLRRRWADQRRRRNSHWEEDLIFWLVLLSACAAMMLKPVLGIILAIAAGVIFIIWLVTLWLYKNAHDNPVGAIRASALLGLVMGYTS
ncbi:hypothetical protein ACRQ1B_01525 [Rhizobium panacihumi]|uniref:hypothetical protein n=1 Tax=Rhizobium panacihumi TaxID=2008450 RepID=UPI003D7944CF